MNGKDAFKLSINNIVTSPLRSMLTVMGMAIGIGAILAVLTLGDAGRMQVEDEMGKLGIDKVWLTAADERCFQSGDGRLLSQLMGVEATEQACVQLPLQSGGKTLPVTVIGCETDYFRWMNAGYPLGRGWWPAERLAGSRKALISASLATELGIGSAETLEYHPLTLGGLCFEPVGVVEQSLTLSPQMEDYAVYLPLQVLSELTGGSIQQIVISVRQGEQPDHVAARAVRLLQYQKGRASSAMTMQVQIEAARNVVGTFVQVLEWVAAICMLVGGIGVMNILLVSVRERRREIGVMKSLGATKTQICALFLIEAGTFSLLGAVLGLAVGLAIIRVAGRILLLSPVLETSDLVYVILSALAVGLGFGVLPASRAAMLTPVDALRD